MQNGFPKQSVVTLWRAGADDLLPEGMEFYWRGHLFRHRPGGHTDGLSSPQFTHGLPACAPRGWAFQAAVAHDGGYHDDLEMFCPDPISGLGCWQKITLGKTSCDDLFLELLNTLADTAERRADALVYYECVKLGGDASFNAGRKLS